MSEQPSPDQIIAGDADDGWVTPIEAVAALAKVYGSRLVAKEALADLLLDGELAAKAERSWSSGEEYLTDAWRSRSDIDYQKDVRLVARDWMDSEDWFNDLTRWRWPQARFVLTSSENPREWRFLEGITFSTADVSRALDLAVGAVSTSKGGPNADVQRWARFWLAAVQLAHDGRLARSRMQSKTQLYTELRKNDPTIFTRRSVDPWIDDIWDKFVAS